MSRMVMAIPMIHRTMVPSSRREKTFRLGRNVGSRT